MVPGYDGLQLIGEGGFSHVYLARQVEFDRPVALKVLRSGLAGDERERFEHECRAIGAVSQHPNMVTVLSTASTTTNHPVMVMELYRGGTYASRLLQQGPLPAEEVCRVGIRVAGALQTAHARGLLHLDVKPQNLLLSDYGEPVLGDLGIATFMGSRAQLRGLSERFAAPELHDAQMLGPQADIYSLAATLHVLLTGREPARSGGSPPPSEVLDHSEADVAATVALQQIIDRGLARQPSARQASAHEFGTALQQVRSAAGWEPCEMVVPLNAAFDPTPAPGYAVVAGPEHTVARPVALPPAPTDGLGTEPEAPGRRSRLSMVLAATILFGISTGLGLAFFERQRVEDPVLASGPGDEQPLSDADTASSGGADPGLDPPAGTGNGPVAPEGRAEGQPRITAPEPLADDADLDPGEAGSSIVRVPVTISPNGEVPATSDAPASEPSDADHSAPGNDPSGESGHGSNGTSQGPSQPAAPAAPPEPAPAAPPPPSQTTPSPTSPEATTVPPPSPTSPEATTVPPPVSVTPSDESRWLLRTSRASGPADLDVRFGRAGEVAVVGDWNGDGRATPGTFRDGRWRLTSSLTTAQVEVEFTFGEPGDVPLVGDWNGDGRETVGVRRGTRWLLRNSLSTGAPDLSFTYALANDIPLVGDWNRDGKDTPGVFRSGQWLLRNEHAGGHADLSFRYAMADDLPLVGDWNGDGRDTPGVVRDGRWLLRNEHASGSADLSFPYGQPSDTPVVGDWNGDGRDAPGVVRR